MIHPLLTLVLQIVGVAAITSWVWTRQYSRYGTGIAVVLGVAGSLVFFDGFTLAVVEESRIRYGRVVPGVVERLISSTDDGIWEAGGSQARSNDLGTYEGLCRFLVTRSADDWIVQYHYSCPSYSGTCHAREYVTRGLWKRLDVGQTLNVRQSIDERTTGRLDENPQRGLAVVKTAIACVLLFVACLLSGRLPLFRRQKYIETDATVTAVERVRYGHEARWKVQFAYFDLNGDAQDSVDEVNDSSWKAGDHCRAVYRPQLPDLATLKPRLEAQADVSSRPVESPQT